MKITDLEGVYPKWRHLTPGKWQSHFWQIVVRVETDTGDVGLGYGGGGEPAVRIVNSHLKELLVGEAIDGVEDVGRIWDMLYSASLPYGRKGIPVMALSGVDLALWDLLGKRSDAPVYELLGGLRKAKVRAYATGLESERYRDLGFAAHKFPSRWYGNESGYDATVERAATARELFGPDALLMIDTYMSWDEEATLGMAARLAEYDIYWFEDILNPDLLDEQAGLRPAVKPVLLAGGEHEFTHHGFADVARTGALDLWQPDLTWCGGITAGLRILELARRHDVPVVPHRGGETWGLHFIAATECQDLAETHPERWTPPNDVLWLDEPEAIDGVVAPLDRPGFGVVLDEAML